MKRKDKPKILCVDDEPAVLEGLELHLRRKYQVDTAEGGSAGLACLSKASYAVVVSDMRMPEMNGAQFLTRVKELAPTTVRMLLTGQTDIESATAAVNEGQIFRFLTKPCPPDRLLEAFSAAYERHRLITAEKELIEQTVHGSIRALTGVLGVSQPLAFGRASRLEKFVGEMCRFLKIEPSWPAEIAALVSQLGCVALSQELSEKVHYGQDLESHERELVDKCPAIVEELLGNIPRLEPVLEIVKARSKSVRTLSPELQRSVSMIQVAEDFDLLLVRGATESEAIGTLRSRGRRYEQVVVEALAAKRGGNRPLKVREIPAVAVAEGMVFAEDVKTSSGMLLVPRGFEVTAGFVAKVRGFRRGYIKEPLRVTVPESAESDAA
ncbi:MAG: response regulator [Myxococcota bacterium]